MTPNTTLTDLDAVFPADVIRLMPAWEDIPEAFKKWTGPWVELAEKWFSQGLSNVALAAKPGIEHAAALRHLSTIMRSFQPKHEHKIAAVAYLMSQWFEERK